MLTVEEIQTLIDSDRSSEQKRLARLGQRYYEGRHDILNTRIFYFDPQGVLREDQYKSNIRISHPFFTELVDQQVQYMLSGGPRHICSNIPQLQQRLDEYFDSDFYTELSDLLTGAAAKGFDYLCAVTDRDGKTRFEYADSLGVVEVRAKDTDDGCEYIIYWYIDRVDKGRKTIKRIQVWDKDQIWFYVQVQQGQILPDDTVSFNPRPHTLFTDQKGRQYQKGFGYLPFFRLDNGRKQVSGLAPIKGLIDDYDLMACSLSNNLQDFTDALYVVRGYQGANLDELVENIKAKKHIGVDSGGGVDIQTVDIPYQARQVKLELDERNIYRFGMGFNSAQVGDGNVTNVVIKSRYALLDLKCNKLQIRLCQLLKKLVKVVLEEINVKEGTDYRSGDVYFDFQREVITNASDNAQIALTDAQRRQAEINTLLGLSGVLDDQTLIQRICDILEIDYQQIKDKLPQKEEDTAAARQTLAQILPEDARE